jgi:hypothetical protein
MIPEHPRAQEAEQIHERLQRRRNGNASGPAADCLPERQYQQGQHGSVECANTLA